MVNCYTLEKANAHKDNSFVLLEKLMTVIVKIAKHKSKNSNYEETDHED